MKIALVYDLIYPYSIGGAESRNFSLAKELVLQGHEVHLFGVKMWSGDKDIKVTKGLHVHGVSHYKNKYSFSGKRRVFDPIKYSFFLFFELMKNDFDVVDVSNIPYFTVFSCKLYSLLKKKPLIVTWHEVWEKYWYEYKGPLVGFFGRLIEKIVAKTSKNNLCVSEKTAKRFGRISKKKTKVINNWIEIDEIKKIKPSKKSYDIISIGRHLEHKNFPLLLRISSILKKDFPKLKVLIIGEGPETEKLLRIRKKLNLEKNVDIVPFFRDKKQIYKYMKSSKIFVLLSELEGFSIVSFEAMACGLPVITLDAEKNALAALVKDAGFKCKKREIEISEKISWLLRSKEERKNMGKKAKKKAKEFDVKKQVEKIENYYKKQDEK